MKNLADAFKDANLDKTLDQIRDELKKVARTIHAIPGKVQNTIDIKWKSYEFKPLLVYKSLVNSVSELELVQKEQDEKESSQKKDKKKPKFIRKTLRKIKSCKPVPLSKEVTWFLVFNLPEGINYSDFKAQEQTFADSVFGHCYIEKRGKSVRMIISNIQLKKVYPYNYELISSQAKDMILPLPMGFGVNGFVLRDLARMLNILLIGVPGAGKSNVQHSWAYTMFRLNKGNMEKPRVVVAFIDLKIGEFKWVKKFGGIYARHPEEAIEIIHQLEVENERRASILEKADSRKLIGYLKSKKGYMPYIVVFVDELSVLANQAPEAFKRLEELSHIGRSQGICIVAATQRPSHTIDKKFSDLKAMFEATLAMRTRDSVNARMGTKESASANLPKVAGRAIFEWDSTLEVQTLYFPDPDESKKDAKFFEELLSELDPIPQIYTDIKGEVFDYDDFYTQKGLLPRSISLEPIGRKKSFDYRTNPFTRMSRN